MHHVAHLVDITPSWVFLCGALAAGVFFVGELFRAPPGKVAGLAILAALVGYSVAA